MPSANPSIRRTIAVQKEQPIRHLLGGALLLIFCVDVLFLPYPTFASATYSALILPLWVIVDFETITGTAERRKRLYICFAGITAILLSFMYAAATSPSFSQYSQETITNSGIVIYMFLAILLCECRMFYKMRLVFWLLKVYLGFVSLLAIIFVIDPSFYFQVRDFWTYGNSLIEVTEIHKHVRFTGTLSDPNNLAVAVCAIASFICASQPSKFIENALILLSVAVAIGASMSVTGLICFAITVFFFILQTRSSSAANIGLLAQVGVFATTLLVAWLVYLYMQENIIFQFAVERARESSIDSRLSRWNIIFDLEKVMYSLAIGDGGVIFWNGAPYKPHNGHFHVYFNFGIVAYLCFIYIFFINVKPRRFGDIVFVVILFLGFSVNVGIYEPRFAGVWIILLAAHRVARDRPSRQARSARSPEVRSARRHRGST